MHLHQFTNTFIRLRWANCGSRGAVKSMPAVPTTYH